MPPPQDYVEGRGQKGISSPMGTCTFCGLRALDPLLQRFILQTNAMAPLLSRPLPPAGGELITTAGLNLTPYQAVVFAMSAGSALKQIYWILGTSNEPFFTPGAVMISIFNTVMNSANSLVFNMAASSPAALYPYSLYAGAALYIIGILVEPIAETQRKIFKDKPQNEGKAYAGGLFSLARNINYGAYTMWRSGMALACGGPIYGSIIAAFFTWDFATRAVPVLEEYCAKKYGEQWKKLEKEVPYRLFPRIY